MNVPPIINTLQDGNMLGSSTKPPEPEYQVVRANINHHTSAGLYIYNNNYYESSLFLPERTLTLTNLCKVLEAVRDWKGFGRCLYIPESKLNEMSKQYSDPDQCKQEMIKEWLCNNPTPSWIAVAKALFRWGPNESDLHGIPLWTVMTYARGTCTCVVMYECIILRDGKMFITAGLNKRFNLENHCPPPPPPPPPTN